MASLNATRKAMAATYQARIAGLNTYSFVPSLPEVPGLIVARPRISYGIGLGRQVDDPWTLELWLLVANVDTPVNEEELGRYLTGAGPRSIRQATEHSRNIRGDYFGLADTKVRNLRLNTADARFEAAGLNHLGAAFTLDVIVTAEPDPPEEG